MFGRSSPPRIFILVLFLLIIVTNGCTAKEVSGKADLSSAREALIRFFDSLHDGRYTEAVDLYGGTYEILVYLNPGLDPDDHAGLLRSACEINGYICLPVKSISEEERISEDEYQFTVEFKNDDGSLFVLGPCCGANETQMPSKSSFPFTVIRDEHGKFHVMDEPIFIP